ncbi:C-type lectin domain family 10 member A-like isoform X2 [Polypterus senegalus]|uniref:C-type lectin domain family 10 member A-like isoform X2 n=1 Tax=Polypterus senegalus TaxID=55291 RepID=UPI001966ADF7|nr:C-type lectin domain family 10 member A-like isoform X2 [Polypterus senegalus]
MKMHLEDIDCDIQQGHNARRQQQGLRCCSHKKLTVMAVFLSGCILSVYRVIEYKLIIYKETQTTSSTQNTHSRDFVAEQTSAKSTKKQQWLDHNGKSYYFETNKKGWDFADSFCKMQSSNLTMIKKTEDMNFILNHIMGHTWVGLKRENEKWNWIDGTAFHNRVFENDVQQEKSGSDCGSIMTGGILLAAPCKTANQWICEKLIVEK